MRCNAQTGHTVHLAQLTGDEIIYIDKVDSPAFDAVKLPSRVGRAVSIYASAVGKTILAYLPRRNATASSPTSSSRGSPTPPSPTTSPRKPNLPASGSSGWAMDNGEHDAYVMCVAAPVRDSRGQVIAAASITAIEVIASLDQLKSNLPLLLKTADKISSELGYTPPSPASTDGSVDDDHLTNTTS